MKNLMVVHIRKSMVIPKIIRIGSLLSLRKEKTACLEKKVGTSNTPNLHKKKIKPSPLLTTLRMSWKPNLLIRMIPAQRNIPLL